MIRLFLDICKCFHENKNELEIIYAASKLLLDNCRCPHCGASAASMHKDGCYQRDLICYEHDQPVYHKVTIQCVECTCGHSHALEPAVIVPYSSFSLGFLLAVVYARITGRFVGVEELCSHFSISQSTFYRIYKRFLVDAPQLIKALGEMLSFREICLLPFPILHAGIHAYADQCGHSFLQLNIRSMPLLYLGKLPPYISRYIGNGI